MAFLKILTSKKSLENIRITIHNNNLGFEPIVFILINVVSFNDLKILWILLLNVLIDKIFTFIN